VSSTAISFETLVFDSISLHPLGYGQASDAGNAINIRTSPKRSIRFGLERPLSSNNEGRRDLLERVSSRRRSQRALTELSLAFLGRSQTRRGIASHHKQRGR
jgi:hypothetical protein